MGNYRIAAGIVLAAAALVSCSRTAKIELALASSPDTDIVVKALDVNKYTVLDTLHTDAAGKAVCKVGIEDGEPEFYYIYRGGEKIADLLLERGDRVVVSDDSLGVCSVSGSAMSEELYSLNRDFNEVAELMSDIAYDLNRSYDDREVAELKRQMGETYVGFYRKSVKYVLENSKSMTVIPVFYRTFSDGLPVFGQETDGITMTAVADSLATVYPKSKYVKALREEATNRMNYMSLLQTVRNAPTVSYFDVELPDLNADKVKLSEVDAPLTLLHFWTASDPEQCRINLDVLKKYWDRYHDRGFQIYSVAIDLDKTNWAKIVRKQDLPWINVCDSRGANSPCISQYNLSSLPASFFICKGELVNAEISDEKSLGAMIDRLLR